MIKTKVTPGSTVGWTKKEVCLVIECLRYAQRGDFTTEKEAKVVDKICERINLGDTITFTPKRG